MMLNYYSEIASFFDTKNSRIVEPVPQVPDRYSSDGDRPPGWTITL
jgi:hypothetical protein